MDKVMDKGYKDHIIQKGKALKKKWETFLEEDTNSFLYTDNKFVKLEEDFSSICSELEKIEAPNENVQISKCERVKRETNLKVNTILKSLTKSFHPEVERIAKNYGFQVQINKNESTKVVRFKKENVSINWYFTTGTVTIQERGINISFPECTVNQFFNIMENPSKPKKEDEDTESEDGHYQYLSNNEEDRESEDQYSRYLSNNENDSVTETVLVDLSNVFKEPGVKKSNANSKINIKESPYGENFNEQHIKGNHKLGKPINSVAAFDKTQYKPITLSGNKDATPKGTKEGQIWLVTKDKLPFVNTGANNFGKTGESHFVVAAQQFPDGNIILPGHLGGQALPREDGRFELPNGEVYSQRYSQPTQRMQSNDTTDEE